MKVRLPDNGMGGNMQSMLKQAQEMQTRMAELQTELEAREYEVAAGGGMVNVKINGKKQILSMSIKPEIVDPDDVETLEDVVTAAVNEAIRLVEDTSAEEMAKVTGPLGAMGGLGGMGGLI